MTESVSKFAQLMLKIGAVAILLNEVRGFVLAGPVLYMMYKTGGTWMAMWLGFCSLAGIALSVAAPLFVAKKLQLRLQPQLIR